SAGGQGTPYRETVVCPLVPCAGAWVREGGSPPPLPVLHAETLGCLSPLSGGRVPHAKRSQQRQGETSCPLVVPFPASWSRCGFQVGAERPLVGVATGQAGEP